ncbi:MAG: sulfurtransferase [Planctomycetes bacterium]|nr:sulfurtransferase [Planctomycetota bacterium]
MSGKQVPAFDIRPEELKALLDGGLAPLILDVRWEEEVAICRLPGSVHIPMDEVPHRLGELTAGAEIVVHCHTGMRSAEVTQYLRERGFRARNLAGGIDLWGEVVDPSMPRY